jgi:O-antigen/teichoic acid export membrane protein
MRTIILNLASVVGGEAAVRAANFVAVLFIARTYGGATLGVYATCLAVITVALMFADNGLQTSAITQLSSTASTRNRIIGQLAVSKTILLASAVLLLPVIAAWTKPSPLLWAIGGWVTLRIVLQSYSQLQLAILKSVSKANLIGIIQFLHSLFLLAVIWLSFKEGWSVLVLLAWMTFCQFLEVTFGFVVLYRSGIHPLWPERLAFWATMRMATPFGITYGLANLIIRLDTIVLATLVSAEELGAFSAANAILLAVYVSAWLFGSILLPEMVRLAGRPENLKHYVNQWARWVILLTVPGSLVVYLTAPRVIVLLYGPAFSRSGAIASVLALACPFILLNSVYTTFAVTTNNRAIFLGIFASAAAVTLGLDLLLGHAFESMGVASAIVLREAGMLVGFLALTSRISARTSEGKATVSPEGFGASF